MAERRTNYHNNHYGRKIAAGVVALGALGHFANDAGRTTSPGDYILAGTAIAGQALADEHKLVEKLGCSKNQVPNISKKGCISKQLAKIAGVGCKGHETLFCGPKPTVVEAAANGETISEWKVRAKEITNPNSRLFQQLCASQTGKVWYDRNHKKHVQVNCQGMCAYIQGALWGYSSTGWGTAQDQWDYLKAHGEAHPGNRRPPVGALLFYNTGKYAGHVASYYGNDEIVSSDLMDHGTSAVGRVYIEPAGFLEGEHWNLGYEGWAEPIEHGGTLNYKLTAAALLGSAVTSPQSQPIYPQFLSAANSISSFN